MARHVLCHYEFMLGIYCPNDRKQRQEDLMYMTSGETEVVRVMVRRLLNGKIPVSRHLQKVFLQPCGVNSYHRILKCIARPSTSDDAIRRCLLEDTRLVKFIFDIDRIRHLKSQALQELESD